MSDTFTREIRVGSELVDYEKKVKLSSFMNWFQQCSVRHTEELGMGRHMTFDKGFLWVIISEHILINRMPEYDEEIVIESTPGMTLHYFFPRNIVIKNKNGEILVKANALWALIDKNTRQFIDPSENGIIINGINRDTDVVPVIKLKVPELHKKKTFTATYSMVDINGHLGNTHYMDLMNDIMFENDGKLEIKEATILFKKEIPMKNRFVIKYEKIDGKYYFQSKYFEAKFN